MTPDPDDSSAERPRLDLVQIAAGALAAVTAAVIGSRLGVNGTVIGAAVGSVIGSVGSASYAHFLGRTASRVRVVALAPERADRGRAPGATSVTRLQLSQREDREPMGQQPLWDTGPQPLAAEPTATEPTATESTATEFTATGAATTDPTAATASTAAEPPTAEPSANIRPDDEVDARSRRPSWRAAVLAAVGTFVLALVALTAFELLSGRPVSTITGGSSGGGTTLSDLFDPPPATPSPTPTESPSPTATETSTTPETSSPSPTQPTGSATPTETPTSTPTANPSETTTSTPSTTLPARLPLEGLG